MGALTAMLLCEKRSAEGDDARSGPAKCSDCQSTRWNQVLDLVSIVCSLLLLKRMDPIQPLLAAAAGMRGALTILVADLVTTTAFGLASTNALLSVLSVVTAGTLLAEGTESSGTHTEAFECGAVGSDGWIGDVVEIRTSILAALLFELEVWVLLSSSEDSSRSAGLAVAVLLVYTSFSCVEVAT